MENVLCLNVQFWGNESPLKNCTGVKIAEKKNDKRTKRGEGSRFFTLVKVKQIMITSSTIHYIEKGKIFFFWELGASLK